jgi:hypothetical protein
MDMYLKAGNAYESGRGQPHSKTTNRRSCQGNQAVDFNAGWQSELAKTESQPSRYLPSNTDTLTRIYRSCAIFVAAQRCNAVDSGACQPPSNHARY